MCVYLQPLHHHLSILSLWPVDDAFKSHLITLIKCQAEIGNTVLDLFVLEEVVCLDYIIVNLPLNKLCLYTAGIAVGTVDDSDLIWCGSLFYEPLNLLGYIFRFLICIVGLEIKHFLLCQF